MRASQRNVLAVRLLALGPATVYGALLDYALSRNSPKPAGYAAHLFKELYGAFPNDRQRWPALKLDDPMLVMEWVALRPKAKHIKAEKPAPLLEQIKPLVDADGFTPGTLMRPEDWEVKW